MILTIVLTAILLVLAGILYALYRFYTAFSAIMTLFQSPDGQNPSPANVIVQGLIETASKQVAIQIKTSLMGSVSALTRQANAIENEIAGAALESQSPVAGGLLELVPGLKKKILKNPAMLQMAMSLFAKKGMTSPAGDNHSAQGSFASDLKKYGG